MIVNNYKCLNYATTAAFTSILLLFVSPLNANSQLRSIQNPDSEPSSHHRDLKEDHAFGSRIIGGDNAGEGEFKFMVSWDKACGGSLIHDQLVLTSGDCGEWIYDGKEVRIGSDSLNSGGVTRQVAQTVTHPNYKKIDFIHSDYDYMILQFDDAVNISEYPPIDLNSNGTFPIAGDLLTVFGFGSTIEDGDAPSPSQRLKKVDVSTISNEQCKNQYNEQEYNEINESIHLCAGSSGKDSCVYDEGGPIFIKQSGNPVQVGVVSKRFAGCAQPEKSGMYARVSGGYDWIQSKICELATVNIPDSCLAPTTSAPAAPAPTFGPTAAPPTTSAPAAPAPTWGPTAASPTVWEPPAPTWGPTAASPTVWELPEYNISLPDCSTNSTPSAGTVEVTCSYNVTLPPLSNDTFVDTTIHSSPNCLNNSDVSNVEVDSQNLTNDNLGYEVIIKITPDDDNTTSDVGFCVHSKVMDNKGNVMKYRKQLVTVAVDYTATFQLNITSEKFNGTNFTATELETVKFGVIVSRCNSEKDDMVAPDIPALSIDDPLYICIKSTTDGVVVNKIIDFKLKKTEYDGYMAIESEKRDVNTFVKDKKSDVVQVGTRPRASLFEDNNNIIIEGTAELGIGAGRYLARFMEEVNDGVGTSSNFEMEVEVITADSSAKTAVTKMSVTFCGTMIGAVVTMFFFF